MSTGNLKNKIEELFAVNDTAINTKLHVNGEEYELQLFETEFRQPLDFKGQPQHEVKGGLLSFTVRQQADDILNEWMFRNGTSYDGEIIVAPISRNTQPLLTILFQKGRCISYEKHVGRGIGIEINLLISVEFMKINEIEFSNAPKPILV